MRTNHKQGAITGQLVESAKKVESPFECCQAVDGSITFENAVTKWKEDIRWHGACYRQGFPLCGFLQLSKRWHHQRAICNCGNSFLLADSNSWKMPTSKEEREPRERLWGQLKCSRECQFAQFTRQWSALANFLPSLRLAHYWLFPSFSLSFCFEWVIKLYSEGSEPQSKVPFIMKCSCSANFAMAQFCILNWL